MTRLPSSDAASQLVALQRRIIDDDPCPELSAQATQLVMGEGNPDAEIVFIGEAPGKKEDEQGRPFVGASGKLLDEMFDSIGLCRQDVYITNIVKYRPPNNRDPSASEKVAFLPYLLEQLNIIDPKAVVTLGRHSMEYFLPDAKISQAHGHAVRKQVLLSGHKSQSWLIMPLYHPAAVLYNGSLREILIQDIIGLAAILADMRLDSSE